MYAEGIFFPFEANTINFSAAIIALMSHFLSRLGALGMGFL